MARHKDANWNLSSTGVNGASTSTWDEVKIAVLMDLRDELKEMKGFLRTIANIASCGNAIDIPNILRRIDKNTKKPVRKKK